MAYIRHKSKYESLALFIPLAKIYGSDWGQKDGNKDCKRNMRAKFQGDDNNHVITSFKFQNQTDNVDSSSSKFAKKN